MQVPNTNIMMDDGGGNPIDYLSDNINASSLGSGTNSPGRPQNDSPYNYTNNNANNEVESLDLSSYSDQSDTELTQSSIDSNTNWFSNAWSKIIDFFDGIKNSLSQTAAAVTNNAENLSAYLKANNAKDKKPEQTTVTQEDLQSLVGKMDEKQYDEFISGVEDYYGEQIDFLDQILNGEDGLIDLRDRLIMFNVNNGVDERVESVKNSLNTEINFYYEQFQNGTADYEQYGITYEEFMQLDYPDQLKFVSENVPHLVELIASNEQFMREYWDEIVKEQLGDLGISTYDEYVKLSQETSAQISEIQELIQNTKNFLGSAKYDYLYYLEDFQNFSNSSIDIEEYQKYMIDAIDSVDSMSGYTYLSYPNFHNKHPEVDPVQFIQIAKAFYGDDGLYNIGGISDVEAVASLAEVYDLMPNYAKTYQYLYNQDPDKANEFLKECKYEINNVRGQLLAKDFLSGLGVSDGEHDGVDAVANELGVSVQGLLDGLDSFGRGAYYSIEALMVGLGIMEENRIMTPTEYKKMYILQGLLSEKAKEAAGLIYKDENGEYHNTNENSIIDYTVKYAGPVLSNNYEISQGIGNMVPSMIASYFCPLAGSIMMGVSSGGNAYHGAMVEGQSYLSSLMYGAFTGTSEAITERFLGGLPGLSDIQVTSLKTYLQAMAREGFQESFQGVMDSIYQAAFMGHPLPSTLEGWEEYGKSILKQGAYGAITAGILQSPSLIHSLTINNVDTDGVDQAFISDDQTVEELAEGAIEGVDEKTSPIELAEKESTKPAPKPDYFDNFDSKIQFDVSDEQIENLASRLGVTEGEVRQVLNAKMQQFFDEGEFACRVSSDTLGKILFGDMMLKNQFETGTSDGLNDPDTRRNVEEAVFGVPRDLPDSDRPIYGMLIPSLDSDATAEYIRTGPGYWYGQEEGIVLIFDKEKVIDATSYTIGDSLDYERRVSPGKASDPSFESGFGRFGEGICSIEDLQNASIEEIFRGPNEDEYLELQYHGEEAHSMENIKEVVFTKDPPSQEIIDRLTSLGIGYRIMN